MGTAVCVRLELNIVLCRASVSSAHNISLKVYIVVYLTPLVNRLAAECLIPETNNRRLISMTY